MSTLAQDPADPSGGELHDPQRLASLALTGLMGDSTDEVLDRMTRLAARVLGAPVSLVSLVDDSHQHFASQVGLATPWAEQRGTPLSHSFCQHVVTGGEPLVVTDAPADTRVADNKAIGDLGVQAYAGFPLVDVEGQVLGSFCVIDDQPREWTTAELETIADIAAAAASEIRSRSALRVAASRVTMLADLTMALQVELDVDAALAALAARLVPELGVLCAVDLVGLGPGGLRSVAVTSVDPGVRATFLAAEAVAPRAVNPRSGVRRILDGGPSERLVFDLDAISRLTPEDEQQHRYRSLGVEHALMVAITGPRGTQGVITLGRAGAPYRDDEVVLLEEMGRRVGLALENARLYAREREAALALQASLLPRLPALPGLDLAARYLPSLHAGRVGGDWYDVLALPDGSIAVAVGDVAGHDLAAAARMGQMRAVLRAYAWDSASPGEVLDRVCRLVRGLDEEQIATLFYGVLSPVLDDGSRSLTYANAGHPPPVLLAPDGSTTLLSHAVGPVIGFDLGPRAQRTVTFPSGGTFVGYSDGLVESRRGDLDVSIAVLRGVVAEHGALAPEPLTEALLAGMAEHRSLEDDLALLVLRTS